MRIIQNISEDERLSILNDLYKSFETGFDFEDFLKPFLEALGLKEVVVTKKTGDGGIDLLGIMPGLSELENSDSVQYKIQAKRNNPSTIIAPEKIDALRGNLTFNQKGLFITTARVSEKAKEEATKKDPSKPIIVIDGNDLVNMCIQKQIGFAYKPVFSKDALDEFLNKKEKQNLKQTELQPDFHKDAVKKAISSNDIRARIISVPSCIVEKIKDNEIKHNITLLVNGETFTVSYNPSRNYLGSVTNILKKFKLLRNDGSYNEKTVSWSIDKSGDIISIFIDNN